MDSEEEAHRSIKISNKSAITTQHSSSFSSGSDTEIDITRCRSMENFFGHTTATRDPEEILLMQTNLKMRLRNFSKYIELPGLKPCNEQRCPIVKQRLEEHRHRCHLVKNTIVRNPPKDEACCTSVVLMPETCDRLAQTASKKIKDEATVCKYPEQRKNIQDAVAEVRQSIQTTATMTAFEAVRRTRSCNTTVSFKNFYKDRLQHEVLQWLREVPIEAEFNSAQRIITERIVNDLIEKIYKLFSKANSDGYEAKLKNLIGCCLNSLPGSYHSAKCDKTKHILTESLITRVVMLNNKYIFAPSTSTSGIHSLYPCGFDEFEAYTSREKLNDIPITKLYRKDTLNWLHSKRLKRKDDRTIDMAEVTETFLDLLLPLLYDKEVKNCKYLMMGSIIEILDKFPLVFTGNNKRLYLNGLAAELTTILLKTRAAFESPTRSSSACSGSFRDFLSNPKNFLRQLRKRKAVKECLESCSDYNYNSVQASTYNINFFRFKGHRLIAAVSSEVVKSDFSYTNLKVSDLIFRSVHDGFDDLSILYGVSRNSKKSNESCLLRMTFNFPENIDIKASSCRSDIFKLKYESRVRNKNIYYGLMFMVWIANKSLFHNESNRRYFESHKLTDNGTSIYLKTLNISEREILWIKNLLNLLIEYGSFKTHAITLPHKKDILVDLKKSTSASLPKLKPDPSAMLDFTKSDVTRRIMFENYFRRSMPRNINSKKQLIVNNNMPAICRRLDNNLILDREITTYVDIKVTKSRYSSFVSPTQYFTNNIDITF